MARPSERDVEEALRRLGALVRAFGGTLDAEALAVLREAARPRVLLPTKEAAELLGVDPANLEPSSVRGLPDPAQVIPRPTSRYPDRVMRLWDAEEIRECAAGRRPRREREDG